MNNPVVKEIPTQKGFDPSKGRWRLMRQDDPGNRYIVADFDSETEARQALAAYESQRHKQTYWIEEKGP